MSDRRLASPAFHALPDDDIDDVSLFLLMCLRLLEYLVLSLLLFVAEMCEQHIHGVFGMQATAGLLAASSSEAQEPAHVQELRRQLADQQRLVNELLTNGRPRGMQRLQHCMALRAMSFSIFVVIIVQILLQVPLHR